MYICGPTVYDLPHLGHGRYTLVWDSVRRWLTYNHLDVDFVSNITDIDDNIINRAAREGVTEADIAAQYEQHWWEAMDAIGVARPTRVPHATQYVTEMVELISSLIDKDVAYRTSDGVYLDVSKVDGYGGLAGQSLDSLQVGARVDANVEKRSPFDFALWKAAKEGDPSWAAPFGDGRPGWHTECVVMSLGLLGPDFDLHVGGQDLRFPHHENERAQAIAAGTAFARRWAHSGWVMVGDEKMSKSLGNFTSLTDLIAKTDPRAYRLLVLRSHYRSPIEVSAATIDDAERGLARLDSLARRFDVATEWSDFARRPANLAGRARELDAAVSALLDDDFNSPQALALIFEAVSEANATADRGDAEAALDIARASTFLLAAMGLTLRRADTRVDQESLELAAERDAARAARDFARSDQLRDELVTRGWIVEDTAAGTQLRRAL
jgi:cysteinyl-tRNA synthetase